MKVITCVLLSICSLAIAAPDPTPESEAAIKTFYLQTEVIPGQNKPQYDGLYVKTLHTGAGVAQAVLGPLKDAAPGHLNGTRVVFNYSKNKTQRQYLGIKFYNDYYESWGPTSMNYLDYGSPDFVITKNLRLTNKGSGFGGSFVGWRVCDWALNHPQLFHDIEGTTYPERQVPASCAKVNLNVIYIAK